jgi:tetratricopeptide (TPR) repeat protein
VDKLEQYLKRLQKELVHGGELRQFVKGFFGIRERFHLSRAAWLEFLSARLSMLEQLLKRIASAEARCRYRILIGGRIEHEGLFDIAEKWLRRAANKALDLKDAPTRCTAFLSLGLVLNVNGKQTEAEEWLRRAAQEAEGLASALTRCNAFFSLGYGLNVQGKQTEAEKWVRRAAQEAEGVTDALTRSGAFRSLGNVLDAQGKYAEAEEWLRRAAQEAEGVTDALTRCSAFDSLGNVLGVQRRYAEAEEWLRRAAQEAEGLASALTRCNAFRSLGSVLGAQGKYAEAEEWLRHAAQEAEGLTDALTRCNVFLSLGTLHGLQDQFATALKDFQSASAELLQLLSANRWPDGVANIAAMYGDIFDWGLVCCDTVYAEKRQKELLWQGLSFVDGLRCVSIREGLRQLVERATAAKVGYQWTPGQDDPDILFERNGDRLAHPTLGALRELHQTEEIRELTPMILERTVEASNEKQQFTAPIRCEELVRLLPDVNTILVVFHFVGNNLYVLPIRRGANGQPALLHDEHGFFRVPGVRSRFHQLRDEHATRMQDIKAAKCYESATAINEWFASQIELREADRGSQFDQLGAALGNEPKPHALTPDEIHEEVGLVLRLDGLLEQLEPRQERWKDLHLVLIPDGPLFQLPLHAARLGGKPLIDTVASVRYGLSLRTLELQQRVEDERREQEANVVALQGAVFANPSGPGQIGPWGKPNRLDKAKTEVGHLVAGNPSGWRCFGERQDVQEWLASRLNLRNYHPTPNVLRTVCHGGPCVDEFETQDGRTIRVVNPSLLLCDGPVSTARMYAEGYDLRRVMLFHNSCCLLGDLRDERRSRQVEGYISVLTLLGCRRVCSAMWELADHAAAEFAKHWLEALKKHVFRPGPRSPHSFAVAFKEAITAFRNTGKFDHEFYWSPYTLFGVG